MYGRSDRLNLFNFNIFILIFNKLLYKFIELVKSVMILVVNVQGQLIANAQIANQQIYICKAINVKNGMIVTQEHVNQHLINYNYNKL